ncbi:Cupredoxin [Thozetella sp. PMI_491]|nr:Cupredoxin [Thozetella sp. PMI_491]
MNLIRNIIAVFALLGAASGVDLPHCLEGMNLGEVCTEYGYEETWTITEVNPKPDVKYIAVNGQFPPPTITISKGQRIRIVLDNQLPGSEPVSLHFHGILQDNGYTFMDGPTGIVQSGVTPSRKFVYDFPVNQAGTFWIHSHYPGQYPQGLRSPLIVQDDTEAALFGYDKEYDWVLTVSDWWPDFKAAERLYRDNACSKRSDDGRQGIDMPPRRLTVNDIVSEWNSPPTATRPSKYVLPQGKKARLRIINMSSTAQVYGLFSDWRPEIEFLEMDGVHVIKNQNSVGGFSLASGQRLSIILTDAPQLRNPQNTNIYFMAEPRVSGNITSSCQDGDNCCVKPTEPDTDTLYAWVTVVGDPNITPILPTNKKDFANGPDDKGMLKKNKRCIDSDIHPYYTDRLKLDLGWLDRGKVVKDPSCPIDRQYGRLRVPFQWWGYSEFDFSARDGEAVWWPYAWSTLYVHEIYMVDSKRADNLGRGVMGTTLVGETPDNPFSSPESPPNVYPSMPSTTTLERTLMDGLDQEHLYDPAQYWAADGHALWVNTILLYPQDAVHWLVVRTTRGDHPLHLHGHEFQIVARLPAGTTDEGSSMDFNADPVKDDYSQRSAPNYPFAGLKAQVEAVAPPSPVRRDTFMIERGWTYILAVKANNPGVWALHCHNDFHASTGMMIQVVELPNELRGMLGTYSFQTSTTEPLCPVTGVVQSRGVGNGGVQRRGVSSRVHPRASFRPWPGVDQLFTSSWRFWGFPQDVCWTTPPPF